MAKSISSENIVNWLINSLRLEATIFHAGRYCGAWQASTAGRLLGSFHLVLDGSCWLHRPGHDPIALQPRDSVLFLRDVPHRLSSEATDTSVIAPARMGSLDEPVGQSGTDLACGFFQFRGSLTHHLLASLPEFILIRANDVSSEQVNMIFQLVRLEAGGEPDNPTPLFARLVEVLFFYAIRLAVFRQDLRHPGIWRLASHPRMANLLSEILAAPGRNWTIDQMASHVHMSKTNFCRHFITLTGQPPATFLASLRVGIAAQRLEGGDSIEAVADHVGYRSSAAFSRAFKKFTGEQPGAWRRTHRQCNPATLMQ